MVQFSNMSVELLDFMGDDLSIVDAARVSFDKVSEWEYDDSGMIVSLSEGDKKLINYLAKHNHWTPFAHTSLKFRIKAPIFVARQLVKHGVGGVINEVSRRYVKNEPEFYSPPQWRKAAINVKQGSSPTDIVNLDKLFIDSRKGYGHSISNEFKEYVTSSLLLYNTLLKNDVCAEQARMVLPQNMMTEWIWTGSLAFFARVCNLRLDPHSQMETQEIAKKISNECLNMFPIAWEALVTNELFGENNNE